jgi:schlafen family protein
MTPTQLSALLIELLALPQETEWVEWKHNNDHPEMIAQRLPALANSAALHGRNTGFMVWEIEDGTKAIVGTTFKPRQSKKGGEELEHWLVRSLHPQVNLHINEWKHNGHALVLMEVSRATYAPVRFGSEAFLRIGTLTKKLKDYPAKEAALWASFSKNPFGHDAANGDLRRGRQRHRQSDCGRGSVSTSGPRLRGDHDNSARFHEGDVVRSTKVGGDGLARPHPSLLPTRLFVLRVGRPNDEYLDAEAVRNRGTQCRQSLQDHWRNSGSRADQAF